VSDNKTREKALTGLAAALVVTIGAWFFIDHATDRGLERLQLIDRVWSVCDSAYATALTGADTSRIDSRALSAAVDSGKDGAPRRCGDMRRPVDAEAARDSARKAQELRSVMPTRTPR
jgi:hypothetical protein